MLLPSFAFLRVLRGEKNCLTAFFFSRPSSFNFYFQHVAYTKTAFRQALYNTSYADIVIIFCCPQIFEKLLKMRETAWGKGENVERPPR